MIPFRVGDDVKVTSPDTFFGGAAGWVRDIYPVTGTVMVELEEWGTRVPRGLVLPFASSELASVRCQHPTIGDDQYRAYIDRQSWLTGALHCPDCGEWLYPDDLDGSIRVFVGEPRGAGMERL